MAVQDLAPEQDPENPETIVFWESHARQDRGPAPVSDYLFESGDTVDFGECTVPTADYTSPEFAALEAERLWLRTWQVACRANEIPRG